MYGYYTSSICSLKMFRYVRKNEVFSILKNPSLIIISVSFREKVLNFFRVLTRKISSSCKVFYIYSSNKTSWIIHAHMKLFNHEFLWNVFYETWYWLGDFLLFFDWKQSTHDYTYELWTLYNYYNEKKLCWITLYGSHSLPRLPTNPKKI